MLEGDLQAELGSFITDSVGGNEGNPHGLGISQPTFCLVSPCPLAAEVPISCRAVPHLSREGDDSVCFVGNGRVWVWIWFGLVWPRSGLCVLEGEGGGGVWVEVVLGLGSRFFRFSGTDGRGKVHLCCSG
jgi:hypothetical protein